MDVFEEKGHGAHEKEKKHRQVFVDGVKAVGRIQADKGREEKRKKEKKGGEGEGAAGQIEFLAVFELKEKP